MSRWYKRCGADFIHGTMMLTLEEKGAYSLCLDLIYDRSGPIPDDARWLAGVCGVSTRKWNAIRNKLVDLGKLTAENGHLSNVRADFELVSSEFRARERAESGAKGGRKRAENQGSPKENSDLAEAELKQPPKQIREEEIRCSVDKSTGGEPPDPLKELFDLGVSVLKAAGHDERQARSLIGKWRKGGEDGEVLAALVECRTKGISNPVEWIPKRLGGCRYVSASGYQYRGDDEAVMREAERRSDWDTYWAVKAEAEAPESTGPPRRSNGRRGRTASIGQLAAGMGG